MAAVANFATMQTNATARGLAYEAHSAAGKAMAAYLLAKEASEAAAGIGRSDGSGGSTDHGRSSHGGRCQVRNDGLRERCTAAETAAIAELMIDGKDKNVGGTTSVNADAASSVVTTVTGTATQTEETGRIKTKDPKHLEFWSGARRECIWCWPRRRSRYC